MTQIFLTVFEFFHRRKWLFWVVFSLSSLGLGLGASQIRLEEDITKFFPDDERVQKLSYVFENSKFVERMVVMVSIRDSARSVPQDSLVQVADALVAAIDTTLSPLLKSIHSRVDDEKILSVFQTVHDFLPIFLNDDDYAQLDSLTNPLRVKPTLEKSFRQLISPSGIAVKRMITQDPLGFSFLALRKLQQLQYDENFELYDGYIITKDQQHLIFFLQPAYPPNDTGHNAALIRQLDEIMDGMTERHPDIRASYFGAAAVAVGNAEQLRADTVLTVSILVVLLAVLLIGFFKKKRVPFLILVPVAFGGVFSLCCIFLIKGSVSILAIAAGSVILGIAVNYALHFLAHLRHVHDVRQVIADLVKPMTLGSATTVLAFFCLQFANAGVLRDVGLFAGFSLIGAALSSLIFLPQLIPTQLFPRQEQDNTWIDRLAQVSFRSGKLVPWIVALATPVFFYFALRVTFNSDMSKLNFMKSDRREAQARLEAINKSTLSTAYVVSSAPTLEQALRHTERTTPLLQRLKAEDAIQKFSQVSSFLISDSLQEVRIRRWNSFWTAERRQAVVAAVRKEAAGLKFSPLIVNNFENLVNKSYVPADHNTMGTIRSAFFDDYIIDKDGTITIISLVNVGAGEKATVYPQLTSSTVHVFDRQMLTNLFVEYVNADFNFIVTFTAILVFVALLVSYGRIELTIITFVPMFITWIWILGIMALLGIEFNIVNVMVSTFIFGLGDDYSIFIMDGLQQEYSVGKKNLASIRTSIFLSAMTTIAGLGVLIFAKHPALRSIASISIIGIACVFVMAQTIEPFLFRALITRRTERGLAPMTWLGILRTLFTYTFFVLGAVAITLIGLVFRAIPFRKEEVRLLFHRILSTVTRALIYVEPNVRKRIIGKTPEHFARPAVIIANHTSFLDILLTIMLHPKLILLTNDWVWNSPVFGGVVRLAQYYPVSTGAEQSVDRLRERVAQGYSIVIFPEGKRSENGKLNRFHKGAFYIAEVLKIPVQPLLIHGAADAIPKGSFYLNEGQLTLKFLPAIVPGDTQFGESYAERTKSIGRYFGQEYAQLARELEKPEYFAHKLITSYLYKGPVLEWYMRIKIRLERNYEVFDQLLPSRGTILDLGCGYGFLCYLLHSTSEARTVIGVDYDQEKIDTASHNYLKTDRIAFYCSDVNAFPLARYDGIVISDVLHYLNPEAQEALLERCFESLQPGGKLIVRDGNADLRSRHWGTRITEFFSVKLLRFNKSTNALHFVSGEHIAKIAIRRGLTVEVKDESTFTSNVMFVMSKRSE